MSETSDIRIANANVGIRIANANVDFSLAPKEGGSSSMHRSQALGASLLDESRIRRHKSKTDADTALESLVGHDIYVYGTGGAREVRRDGVLRKV